MENDVFCKTLEQTEAFVGSSREVNQEIDRLAPDTTVIAVVVPHGQALEVRDAIKEMIRLVPQVIASQDERDLQRFVELMLPKQVVAGPRLKEFNTVVNAMRVILNSGEFTTAATIAESANVGTTNPIAQPGKWKRNGSIFAFTYRGEDYFPLFGLDRSGSAPLPQLKDIIAVFRNRKDGWGMARWFLANNTYLDGAAPEDVLATDPAAVLAAASEEVGDVLHG